MLAVPAIVHLPLLLPDRRQIAELHDHVIRRVDLCGPGPPRRQMVHEHASAEVLRDAGQTVVDTLLHQQRPVVVLVRFPLAEQIPGDPLSEPIGIGYAEGEGESEELSSSWSPFEGFASASASASVRIPESFRAVLNSRTITAEDRSPSILMSLG
jgi:hypothetical protein